MGHMKAAPAVASSSAINVRIVHFTKMENKMDKDMWLHKQ